MVADLNDTPEIQSGKLKTPKSNLKGFEFFEGQRNRKRGGGEG